jgi:hypothetical protein
MLRQTLGRMLEQPGTSCVVVDYSCPDGSSAWVESHCPAAAVVRVPGQTHFNASAARNAGARHGDAAWLCFVDSDVLLKPGFAAALLPSLAPGGFYRAFSQDGGLGGTFAVSRTDFDRIGGYDEVYACWGEEDNDLYDALQFAGLEPRALPVSLLAHIPHDDEKRTRHYPITEQLLGHAINRVYRILKWDIARLRRELLPLAMRRGLYDKVAEVVTASIRSGQPGDLAAHLPEGLVPGGWSLARQLTYRLTKSV